MISMRENDVIATHCEAKGQRIHLRLKDGRTVSFAAADYPLLERASDNLLAKVKLCLGGRALRWEELDEDIWVASAVAGKHPRKKMVAA